MKKIIELETPEEVLDALGMSGQSRLFPPGSCLCFRRGGSGEVLSNFDIEPPEYSADADEDDRDFPDVVRISDAVNSSDLLRVLLSRTVIDYKISPAPTNHER